ncbi:MAG: hypothetical protein KAH38_07910 [Candidatus Hydrogenedentes bacterium]|nr:hypothetical protein [Candidatus Hydrogenedentota bacterium]
MRPDTNGEYKFTFSTKAAWGSNYWVRVGVRNGMAPLSVKPLSLERLYRTEFTSEAVTLPKGIKVSLTMPKKGNEVFEFQYDLLSAIDDKVLMANCNGTTDISGLAYLDISEVKIRIKLLTNIAGSPVTCPKLIWTVDRPFTEGQDKHICR